MSHDLIQLPTLLRGEFSSLTLMKIAAWSVLPLACCGGAAFAYAAILLIAIWRNPLGAARFTLGAGGFALLVGAAFGYSLGS